ncbi:MAG: glycosyltransferase [Opitutales bacterium]|nr:glycosyltransferase [Opitutales bacterium]MBT6769219.1 glycosyltransferase [Opitutales bacterium]MBT7864823.1 glycosyltransferase [Opitutales bacterium]
MKVSFIIPVYNQIELTLRCIKTLQETVGSHDYEIIIVDDCSDSETRKKLEIFRSDRIRLISNSTNLGYAKSNNIGANEAKGRILILANNDLEFLPGWLEPILKCVQETGTGIVGNIQIDNRTGKIDHAGFLFDGKGTLQHKRTINGRKFYKPRLSSFHAATGACLAISKDLYLQLGGLDEAFENGCEDIDLCFKVQSEGKSVVVANRSVVKHHVSSTRGLNSLRDERNMRRFQQKWHNRIAEIMIADWPKTYLKEILKDKSVFDWNRFKEAFAHWLPYNSTLSKTGSLIVEAKLKRNERHWLSILDGKSDEMIKASYQSKAKQWLHKHFAYNGLEGSQSLEKGRWIKEKASLQIKSGLFISSVQIAGTILPPGDKVEARGQLGLRITTNGAESKTYYPLDEGDFEINIEDLPDVPEKDTLIEFELAGIWRTNAYAYLGRITRKWFFLSRKLRQFWKSHREQRKNQRLLIKRIDLNHEKILDFESQPTSPVNFDFLRRYRNIGINLVGWFDAELGIGESVRLAAKALDTTTIETNLISLKVNCLASREDKTYTNRLVSRNTYPINVFHIDAPQSGDIDHHHGAHFRKDRRNIAYWAWELPEFPDHWIQYFDYFDEIWTPSNFVRDAIAIKSPLPVLTIPHCIDFEIPSQTERAKFGLPEDQFLFLFAYDLNSYQERKNPMAIIKAFKKAFSGTAGKDIGLVIKTHSIQQNLESFELLKKDLAGIHNVHLIDKRLSRSDVYSLMHSVDSYVSLHRSEGFGLTVAESMFLEKPVISTDWSATSEFLNSTNGCPVSCELIKIKQDFGPYSQGQYWAEPHSDHAASQMLKLVNDSDFAKHIGKQAGQTIRERFSPEAVGKIYEKRIKSLALW